MALHSGALSQVREPPKCACGAQGHSTSFGVLPQVHGTCLRGPPSAHPSTSFQRILFIPAFSTPSGPRNRRRRRGGINPGASYHVGR
eukprot:13339504-Alexandrium_andersonii.AAC.1